MNYETIPELMREREQWICWREEMRDGDVTKIPVNPDTGGFASTTDDSTWVSFDKARDAHENDDIETSGLGFVFAHDSMLMGVDLDDCRDPDTDYGTLEAREIIETLDSWTEVSPSGTGYHVIVQGVVPEGGNRGDIGDTISHLEMYDKSRFFTVTGNHVDGTPDTVEARPSEVQDLHDEYIADDDDDDDDDDVNNDNDNDTPEPVDVDLDDEELLEKAKNSKKGDEFESLWNGSTSAHSNDHSRADIALCGELAFWTGGDKNRIDSLFRSSGLMRDKWDEVHYADGSTYGEVTIDKAVSNKSDFYDPGKSSSSKSGGDSDADEVNNDDDDGDDGIYTNSNLDVTGGGYGYKNYDEDGNFTYFDQITNFLIDVDSFLFRDGERMIKMTVKPTTGEESYDVECDSTVFNDARRFRDNVVTGLTTTFSGGSSDLNEIRKIVGGSDAPIRVGKNRMGLHIDEGEFVTPNGVLTADGWDDSPESAYITQGITTERAVEISKSDGDDYDAEEVAGILERVHKVRNSERGIPALGFVYAATLRPYIDSWTEQFNSLHVTGETGAGKSSTLSVFSQLVGMDGDPMGCDDTKFVMLRALSSTNSIPLWYDEYKPGDLADWQVDNFHNLLRTSTRGSVASRGNGDHTTDGYTLKAPVMISGEQSVQGPAERRRTIQTRFLKSVKEDGSENKKAFAELIGMTYDTGDKTVEPDGYDLQQHAIAYYQFILGKTESELESLWRDARDTVGGILEDNGMDGIDDLPRQGLQTVVFGMLLHAEFAGEMVAEAGLNSSDVDLPTDDDIESAVTYIAADFADGGDQKSHLDVFLELAGRAAREDYLESGSHYTLVHEGKPSEQLAIKMSSTHDMVSKYVRDHDLTGVDLLNSPGDYVDQIKEHADKNGHYAITHSQNTPPLRRCARISTSSASEMLDFDPRDWGSSLHDEDDDEEGVSTGDDDDDNGSSNGDEIGVTRLSEVAQDPTGYPDVTVDVLTVSEPDNEDAPAMRATVKDTSTAMDVISWDSVTLEEGDTVRIDSVKVTEYDGVSQLVIKEGVSDVTHVQSGVGYTESLTPDADDAEQDTTATSLTDGGYTGDTAETGKALVLKKIRESTDSTATVAELAGELHGDLNHGQVQDYAEMLVDDGSLTDTGDAFRAVSEGDE